MSRWWIVVGACAAVSTACGSVDGLGGDGAIGADASGADSQGCTSNAGCDDDNPCTEDVCQVDGACRRRLPTDRARGHAV